MEKFLVSSVQFFSHMTCLFFRLENVCYEPPCCTTDFNYSLIKSCITERNYWKQISRSSKILIQVNQSYFPSMLNAKRGSYNSLFKSLGVSGHRINTWSTPSVVNTVPTVLILEPVIKFGGKYVRCFALPVEAKTECIHNLSWPQKLPTIYSVKCISAYVYDQRFQNTKITATLGRGYTYPSAFGINGYPVKTIQSLECAKQFTWNSNIAYHFKF